MGASESQTASETRTTDPVARAHALGPAIAAAADAIERDQRIPEPLLAQLHAARFARMLLPRSVGGDEIDPWTYLATIEEISRHDASVGWNLFVANSAALIAPFLPLESAQMVFSDPRAMIGWGPPNGCQARAVAGGYRIDGQWQFASGSRHANWMGVHCQVIEPSGTLRLNRFGRPTVRTLLFPREHAEPIPDWDTIGLRGTASESYRVRDLFVPEAFSATREDPALRRDRGPLYAFTMQGLYAVGVAGVGFGLARALMDAFKGLAVAKTPRGLSRLADSALVQSGYARQEAGLGAARAWLIATLRRVWSGADDIAPIGLEDRALVRLACAHAIQAAIEAGDFVFRAAGASAIFRGSPFERRFRDLHTLSQQIQAREAHFEAVGRVMFNGDPDGLFL